MQQHPVPQHISSYEFKLVGDMTLKQFFQLAGGAVIALIFYATPLPAIIKWPLVILFGSLGAALAFLPIEERPLSTWIFAFLKAIYSPTHYTFVATSAENVFAKSSAVADTTPTVPIPSEKPGFLEAFEKAEKNFMHKVTVLFQTSSPSAQPVPTVGITRQTTPEPPPPQGSILEMQTQLAAQKTEEEKPQEPRQAFKVVEEIDIPKIQSVKAGPLQTLAPQPQTAPSDTEVKPVTPIFGQAGNLDNVKQATFTPEAAPPSPPTIPNTIVGQTLTSEGKIIDGAILEIKDLTGKPVRALKTNKVGHFITVTPLQDGEYQIEAEKEGFAFETVKFITNGSIIPPIQIKAK